MTTTTTTTSRTTDSTSEQQNEQKPLSPIKVALISDAISVARSPLLQYTKNALKDCFMTYKRMSEDKDPLIANVSKEMFCKDELDNFKQMLLQHNLKREGDTTNTDEAARAAIHARVTKYCDTSALEACFAKHPVNRNKFCAKEIEDFKIACTNSKSLQLGPQPPASVIAAHQQHLQAQQQRQKDFTLAGNSHLHQSQHAPGVFFPVDTPTQSGANNSSDDEQCEECEAKVQKVHERYPPAPSSS